MLDEWEVVIDADYTVFAIADAVVDVEESFSGDELVKHAQLVRQKPSDARLCHVPYDTFFLRRENQSELAIRSKPDVPNPFKFKVAWRTCAEKTPHLQAAGKRISESRHLSAVTSQTTRNPTLYTRW